MWRNNWINISNWQASASNDTSHAEPLVQKNEIKYEISIASMIDTIYTTSITIRFTYGQRLDARLEVMTWVKEKS